MDVFCMYEGSGYMILCICQNQENYISKRVNFTACQLKKINSQEKLYPTRILYPAKLSIKCQDRIKWLSAMQDI